MRNTHTSPANGIKIELIEWFCPVLSIFLLLLLFWFHFYWLKAVRWALCGLDCLMTMDYAALLLSFAQQSVGTLKCTPIVLKLEGSRMKLKVIFLVFHSKSLLFFPSSSLVLSGIHWLHFTCFDCIFLESVHRTILPSIPFNQQATPITLESIVADD